LPRALTGMIVPIPLAEAWAGYPNLRGRHPWRLIRSSFVLTARNSTEIIARPLQAGRASLKVYSRLYTRHPGLFSDNNSQNSDRGYAVIGSAACGIVTDGTPGGVDTPAAYHSFIKARSLIPPLMPLCCKPWVEIRRKIDDASGSNI
jgi:hypothetical protein